jgi:hypothetical protein
MGAPVNGAANTFTRVHISIFVYLYIIYILFSSLRKQQANFLRMKTQAGEPGGLVGPNLFV